MTKYLYDSYAIIEFIRGNEKFIKYFTEEEGITTFYNLMEVYYSVLREEGEAKADKVLEILKPIVSYPALEDIKPSMKTRFLYKKKKLSYADCLGYCTAEKFKIKFLTGDEGFRNMPNVEFIKA